MIVMKDRDLDKEDQLIDHFKVVEICLHKMILTVVHIQVINWLKRKE
jgi:hypothetical protein